MSILFRLVMMGLIVWGLWRIYTAVYSPPPRRPARKAAQDEWQDILEAIDELPETAEPHRRAQDDDLVLSRQSYHLEDSVAKEGIESIIVHEAEVALSLVREGDENERLAAYHEITIYEKLCAIADGHISEATRRKIDDIHQRALEMICPPEDD